MFTHPRLNVVTVTLPFIPVVRAVATRLVGVDQPATCKLAHDLRRLVVFDSQGKSDLFQLRESAPFPTLVGQAKQIYPGPKELGCEGLHLGIVEDLGVETEP